MEENKPMDWATQQSDAVHRMQKGGGLPGLARAEQIAGMSGRQILEAMVSGELPYPPMNDTMNLALLEVGEGRAVFQGQLAFVVRAGRADQVKAQRLGPLAGDQADAAGGGGGADGACFGRNLCGWRQPDPEQQWVQQ